MSTISYIRMKVDIRLRQMDTKNRTYSVPEVDNAIREAYMATHAMLPPAHVAETGAFTIAGGGDTFTLTLSGTTYADALDVRLQLQSNGRFMAPLTVEELDAHRDGHPTVHLGVPSYFALWGTHQGTVLGRCYPGAAATETVNMFRSRSQALTFSATDLDAAAVYFNEAGCIALAASVAADLLLGMTEEDVKKRRINPAIAGEWKKEAAKLFYQEDARRNDLESVGRVQRWVS